MLTVEAEAPDGQLIDDGLPAAGAAKVGVLAAARGEFSALAVLVATNAPIPTDKMARVALNIFMMELRIFCQVRAMTLTALQIGLPRCRRNPADFV